MQVTFENTAVLKELKTLHKNVLRDSANAINRAATASKKRADKELAGISGAKLMRVKKLSKVVQRARAVGVINLSATIRWAGKKLGIYSLANGRVKPSGSGSVARLKSGNIYFEGAFKASVNKGRHTGLFKRKGGSRSITEIKLSSNPDLFRDRGIGTREEKNSLTDVDKFFNLGVAKRLAKFNKGI